MDAYCERQGKAADSVRFLYDGHRVQATDTPQSVTFSLCVSMLCSSRSSSCCSLIWPMVIRLMLW